MQKLAIPQEKQINYVLDLTIKTPFKLYFNDILVRSESRGTNTAIEINPYVLKNGKYKVKLDLYPSWLLNEKEVEAEDIKNSRILFGSYVKNRSTGKVINYDVNVPLKINVPNSSLPFFSQEWEVAITDLPYKVVGWSNGQNLYKMNQEELKGKVVRYYKNLWEILNNGDGEQYIKLWEKADKELEIFDYEPNVISINEEEIEFIKKNCKDMMSPLENYEMKMYADGKIVTLQRADHTKDFNNKKAQDIYGWSPLIRKGKISGADDFPVKLYLPEGSNEFVIIRK